MSRLPKSIRNLVIPLLPDQRAAGTARALRDHTRTSRVRLALVALELRARGDETPDNFR